MTGTKRFDVGAFAQAIHRHIREHNATHEQRFPITPVLSRLLAHDPTYLPYRTRRATRLRPLRDPRISTVVTIAAQLGTTVGELLGEQPYTASVAERRHMRAFVRFLVVRFGLTAVDMRETAAHGTDVDTAAAE